jgi:hypothetical protein
MEKAGPDLSLVESGMGQGIEPIGKPLLDQMESLEETARVVGRQFEAALALIVRDGQGVPGGIDLDDGVDDPLPMDLQFQPILADAGVQALGIDGSLAVRREYPRGNGLAVPVELDLAAGNLVPATGLVITAADELL